MAPCVCENYFWLFCDLTANRMGLVFVCDYLFSFFFRLGKVVFALCRINFTVYNITNLNVKKNLIYSNLIFNQPRVICHGCAIDMGRWRTQMQTPKIEMVRFSDIFINKLKGKRTGKAGKDTGGENIQNKTGSNKLKPKTTT